MVYGFAAASAVFNPGRDAPGALAGRCGSGVHAAVAAVTEDDAFTAKQVGDGCPGDQDVAAAAGPVWVLRPG